MNIVYITDVHLVYNQPPARLDKIIDTQFKKLKNVLDIARENNAILIIGGDFCDTPRSWYLLPDIMDILNLYKDVKIYAVYGQHDTYFYNKETRHATNLGILVKADLINLLEETPTVFNDVHIYGVHTTESIPEVVDDTALNILIIHAPISDVGLFSSHNYINALDFINTHKEFNIVLCGDIHRRFQVDSDDGKRVILNTGPLLRLKGTEYNMMHIPGVYLIDTNKRKINWIAIDHDPSELVITRDHIIEEKESNEIISHVVSNIKNKDVILQTDIKKNIMSVVEKNELSLDVKNYFIKLMSKKQGE